MESARWVFKLTRRDLSYLRYTIESYDGMATVTTLDPLKGNVEICIAPGCERVVRELLDDLREREGLRIEKVGRNAIV